MASQTKAYEGFFVVEEQVSNKLSQQLKHVTEHHFVQRNCRLIDNFIEERWQRGR
jgi:hypothetical protein